MDKSRKEQEKSDYPIFLYKSVFDFYSLWYPECPISEKSNKVQRTQQKEKAKTGSQDQRSSKMTKSDYN